jgi:hypothetical protein
VIVQVGVFNRYKWGYHHCVLRTLPVRWSEAKLYSVTSSGSRSSQPRETSSPSGSVSKAQQKESKVQSIRKKRRKLQDAGDQLEKRLTKETSSLTGILERVADSLIDSGTTESSEKVTALEGKVASLEQKTEGAETKFEKVREDTQEILRILMERQEM